MEPSITDELRVELLRCIHAARQEETYLPLHELAKLIAGTFNDRETLLLADLLTTLAYEDRDTAPEVGS